MAKEDKAVMSITVGDGYITRAASIMAGSIGEMMVARREGIR